MHQRPRRVELRQTIGNFKTHSLELTNLLTKRFAPIGITRGDLQRRPRHAHCASRRRHPLGDHHLIKNFRRAVFAPDEIRKRHTRITEIDSPRAAAARPHQPIHMLNFDSRIALDDERADGAMPRRIRIGAGVDQKIIRALRADDESFLPVEDVGIAVARGASRHPKKVGAAARFGQRFGDG